MPSAGAIISPKIVVLRDPRLSIPSNKIDSETYVELVCDTPYTKIYFTTDGTKPNPFQIGVAGRESTFKYKAPFQLKEGKRTIKVLAISRDGLQESAVTSKTFQVDSPSDDVDDNSTTLDSFDSMSTISTRSASTASTVQKPKKNKSNKDSKHNKENKKNKKEKRARSASPQSHHQSWDVRGSHPNYQIPGNSFIPWAGETHGQSMMPVTAGTVFYPSVNARPFSPEPDVGFLTRKMIQKLDEQRKMTVADVREAVKELTTPRQPLVQHVPQAIEYMPPRYPEPKACSPGNGNWREQLEHIYAHLIEHAQIDPDFRIALGEPKMGRVLEADFVDGDADTLVLTVSISRYGHLRQSKAKLQTVAKVAAAVAKPEQKQIAKPASKPPSLSKQEIKPEPKPEPKAEAKQQPKPEPKPEAKPEPKPELKPEAKPQPTPVKDPQPYFVTEDYPQEGTLKPYAGFNAEADCEQLRNAMKGLGTNEDAITNVLSARSATQRLEIVKTFKTMYGKDLIAELKSELSGNYLTVCTGLCLSPAEFDAKALNKAIKGLGTDEQALVEILCTRTNAQIKALTAAYKTLFNTDLEKDVIGDTSGHFKRLMVSLLQANREEGNQYDQTKVDQDATKLYTAGEQKKFGTDESIFNVIIASRSFAHLRAVFEAYKKVAGKDIEQSLKSEMSGDLLNGMLTIVRCIKDKPTMFAQVIQKSMKGLGTDDESLLRVVISRCEIDMVQIKQAFEREYKQSLGKWIVDDTSGDFRKILLKLVGEPLTGIK